MPTTLVYKFERMNWPPYAVEFRREFNTPRVGVVGTWLNKEGVRMVAGAKAQVERRRKTPGIIRRPTHRLSNSIHMRHLGNVTGQYLWIGSKVEYAYFVHEGTKPHKIRPREAGGQLVFRTKGGSGVVLHHAREVNHPGITRRRRNPFLSDQLKHLRY